MKPGPPPIPFPLKALRGNPGHQRLRAEPEPLTPKDCPEPPSFITGYAADEWWRALARMADRDETMQPADQDYRRQRAAQPAGQDRGRRR